MSIKMKVTELIAILDNALVESGGDDLDINFCILGDGPVACPVIELMFDGYTLTKPHRDVIDIGLEFEPFNDQEAIAVHAGRQATKLIEDWWRYHPFNPDNGE